MNPLRGNSSAFSDYLENYGFRWPKVFGEGQPNLYKLEDRRYVNSELSKEEILNQFVNNGCFQNTDCHLYLKLLFNFLNQAEIEVSGIQSPPLVSRPRVLLDDRNNRGIQPHEPGNCRPSYGYITASKLRSELSKNVGGRSVISGSCLTNE
jgi:hypothetical protein